MPDDGKFPLSIAVKLKKPLSQPGEPLPGLEAFLQGFGPGLELKLYPLVQSLTKDQLDELADRARQINPNYVATDYSFWCQVATPTGVDPYELVKAMRTLPLVENAYVMRPAPPPVIAPPPLAPVRLSQEYLGPAEEGIDATYARKYFAGGDGAGIGFADIEQGWNLNHLDLPRGIALSGQNKQFFKHGTSVLGVVLMADNNIGGIGVAPSARGRVVSQWRRGVSDTADEIPNTTDAIKAATYDLAAGDVMLLEVQEYAPEPPGSVALMPAEVLEGNFSAIRDAVAAGVVVVEAAANNSMNLDTYVDASGNTIFKRGSVGAQDSGAIMVGAASSTVPHTRIPTSNYGSRVDFFAWGQNVSTTDTDGIGKNNALYTTDFGQTSSAAAIIAGAALIVQGIAQANNRGSPGLHRFSPADLLRILAIGGTAAANGPADGIGVMPNLRRIITRLGVPRKACSGARLWSLIAGLPNRAWSYLKYDDTNFREGERRE